MFSIGGTRFCSGRLWFFDKRYVVQEVPTGLSYYIFVVEIGLHEIRRAFQFQFL